MRFANSEYDLRRFDRPKIEVVDYETSYPFKSIFQIVSTNSQPATGFSSIVSRRAEVPSGAVSAHILGTILQDAKKLAETFDWKQLFAKRVFAAPHPSRPHMPSQPSPPLVRIAEPSIFPIPVPPIPKKPAYRISIWDRIPVFERRARSRAEAECRRRNAIEHEAWLTAAASAQEKNAQEQEKWKRAKHRYETSLPYVSYKEANEHWNIQSALLETEYKCEVEKWASAKKKFEAACAEDLKAVSALREDYFSRGRTGIEDFVLLLLSRFSLPTVFPRNIKVRYDEQSRILLIDSQLPDFHSIPIIKDAKRPAAKELQQIQESTLYAIALGTSYIVAERDEVGAIDSIVFNGWVHFIDGATGQDRDAFILSLHSTKAQLSALQIEKVVPEECFRSLKGLSAKRVINYTPVAPILTLSKDDDRLVEGRNVIDGISSADNLAAMDWQTFEHLVRELFEKEFSKPGTEVRITRASRDRGVDAIVFDPDPIRGGKIVIQAKRYTNTVDASAVRDLFGTVQSEGANKGILVSTSQFGPDAYNFSKGKPITLLDGGNLLHLLKKHGYDFRIDLAEARKIIGKPLEK